MCSEIAQPSTLPNFIQPLLGDARNPPTSIPRNFFNLVYADPPMNRVDSYYHKDYHDFTLHWVLATIPLMKDNSFLVLFTIAQVRFAIESIFRSYFTFEQEVIWAYNFGKYATRHFVMSHDTILIFKRGKPKFHWLNVAIPSQRLLHGDARADLRGRTPGSVWNIARLPGNDKERCLESREGNPAQHPFSLAKRIVCAYTNPGEAVYDPFMGSGTVGRICRIYGRHYFGLDIDPQAYATAIRRCELQDTRGYLSQ